MSDNEMVAIVVSMLSMAGTVIMVSWAFFWSRAKRLASAQTGSLDPQISARLERIEMAVESIAVEVERISEGQRFTTKLLSNGGVSAVREGR